MKKKNLVFHETLISKKDRCKFYGHRSVILWMTGLSGSGKSTIANTMEKRELFTLVD